MAKKTAAKKTTNQAAKPEVKKKAPKKKTTKKKIKKVTEKITAGKKTGQKGYPKKNQYWKLRSKHGRAKAYQTPDALWMACCEYFEWVESNPLREEKAFSYQGDIIKTDVTKMRAMTIQGLCLHLGISDETWANYRQNSDYVGITSLVEKIIYEQKFSGAAADLLNANIIARELGLADKREHSGNVSMVIDNQDQDA